MSDEKENKTNELSDQDLSQITGGDKKATVKTETPTESVSLNFTKIESDYKTQ
jgi:bacteriocin-like protein